jgi:hypothetical protein
MVEKHRFLNRVLVQSLKGMKKDFRRREIEKIIEKSFIFLNEGFYKEINKCLIYN